MKNSDAQSVVLRICISATVFARSVFPAPCFVEALGHVGLALHHNTGDGAGGPFSPEKQKAENTARDEEFERRLRNKLGGRVEARIKAKPSCYRLVSQG